MKKFFCVVLLCASLCASAQKPSTRSDFTTAASFNPSVLLGPDNGFMVGAEHRLKEKLAVVLEAGYIFSSSYFNEEETKATTGFMLRPGIKFYSKPGKRSYTQLQFFYKQVDYSIYGWLGKNCVNGVPSYEQLQNFTYRKKVLSFNLTTGKFFRLTDHVLLELYGGLGVKIKDQDPTESRSCYRNAEGNLLGDKFQEDYIGVNIPFGVKIVVPVR